MRLVATRASARDFRFHSKFINHSDWYKIECSRMGQRACLPRHAPGMCGGNRLRAPPEGKRELKEL
jgi:hypothetical protein